MGRMHEYEIEIYPNTAAASRGTVDDDPIYSETIISDDEHVLRDTLYTYYDYYDNSDIESEESAQKFFDNVDMSAGDLVIVAIKDGNKDVYRTWYDMEGCYEEDDEDGFVKRKVNRRK